MIVRHDNEIDDSTAPSVVAIGVFDGLHRGHQKVLEQMVALSKKYDAVATVVTFDPTPARVLAPDRAPRLLGTIEQRLEGLEKLNVEQVRVLTFDKNLARESARDFIDRVLVKELRAHCVVVGEDFRFGHDRQGDIDLLKEVGRERGFDVAVAPTHGEGERWSSTSVRAALERGDVHGAGTILGRPFCLRGTVMHGDERGHELGFPTANLSLADSQALPSEGVYAGAANIDGSWRAAAISIGTRPQFYEHGSLLVEVHVLDYDGTLYEKTLDVLFLARLRDQRTFDSTAALTSQIGLDVAKTQQIFEEFSISEMKLLG